MCHDNVHNRCSDSTSAQFMPSLIDFGISEEGIYLGSIVLQVVLENAIREVNCLKNKRATLVANRTSDIQPPAAADMTLIA